MSNNDGKFRGLNVLPRHIRFKNAITITPDDDLTAKYDWLKSSDRDAAMGALSETNWRTLVLSPGTYTLTATLTLDTDYIAIVCISPDTSSTIVNCSAATTVNQTADIITLCGFTIKCSSATNGRHAFTQSSSDNSGSIYRFMDFRHTDAQLIQNECVRGFDDINGLWEFCRADDYAWRVAENKDLSATMRFCEAGDYSYGGDGDSTGNGIISGRLEYCTAGYGSFGGCSAFGLDISGTLIGCVAGARSYALGQEFSGLAIDCVGGAECFAGYSGAGSYYGTLSGTVINCEADIGGNTGGSFGMGNASCKLSGQVINCKLGGDSLRAAGVQHYRATTLSEGDAASITAESTGTNNDITITAKKPGAWANDWTFEMVNAGAPGIAVIGEQNKQIKSLTTPGTTTAQTIVNNLNANTTFALYFEASYEGDGSGTIEAFSETSLSGGSGGLLLRGNHGDIPCICVDDLNISAFYNGGTYNNSGASGTITLTLPTPMSGLKYRFVVATAQALRIEPGSAQAQKDINTNTSAAGEYVYSSTVGDVIVLECLDGSTWICTFATQAWSEE